MKNVHSNNQSIECEMCGKVMKHEYLLARHIQEIHQDKRPFACEQCNKRFYRSAHLKLHISNHHVIKLMQKDHKDMKAKCIELLKE